MKPGGLVGGTCFSESAGTTKTGPRSLGCNTSESAVLLSTKLPTNKYYSPQNILLLACADKNTKEKTGGLQREREEIHNK